MSFNTAITGLKAASTMLDVTGNNIANVSTTGFKSSRTQFADLYSTAVVGAGSSNTPGTGVTVSGISQDFSAGTIEFTNNNLDLAINGSGFFQLDDGRGSVTYTRAGAFELNKDGFIVSQSGKFLQGYGLDEQGNQLPVGPLAVSEKESPPKATDNILLSFNIDARADASKLIPTYDKDVPGSFTYTTTVRTFDSLGNEQTIKFNFAEQRPVRNVFAYNVTDITDLNISTIQVTKAILDGTTPLSTDPTVALPQWAIELQEIDPRIDIYSVRVDTVQVPQLDASGQPVVDGAGNPVLIPNELLRFEWASEFTDSGSMLVRTGAGVDIPQTPANVRNPYRDANEIRTYAIAPGAGGNIEIGGVTTIIEPNLTPQQAAQAIAARQALILDRNPAVESVTAESGNIIIRFKADEGNIPDDFLTPTIIANAPTPPATAVLTFELDSTIQGDNSFQGVYRMYGYLNNEQILDLGKIQDPGESGFANNETETGPVIIKFNPSNGLLKSINGQEFPPSGVVPSIVIKNADPADETTELSLNLGNTTQFASASIVKNQQQNGYTKGDLIGVTFAPTGEMIASFSNGTDKRLGVVAFATFENQDGLQPVGSTEWIATLASGNAILNPPGTGLNGTLRSAALEQSNVDLSTELVNLIQAQRNFQANSKTLETANNITQNILNIRT
ncbi:flagellar hook-basal body complex protein [Nitrincola tapanii]|uniref:Flagellar hook protein FlgE n=1 Tax=Nitrincola tapanii TaxID=1708751 RepID=A0A5A9W7S4_9GAMM|nr:flagellar hook-basal body complex protein [Nitrincola tapanii]KAA0876583.1 flagellar hook-basal body complex protein [Nitrincola tapanii]